MKTIETGEIRTNDVRVVIISLIFVLLVAGGMIFIFFELMNWDIPFLPKILIILMSLTFIYDRIISRASEYLTKMFEEMSKGSSLRESFDAGIEQESEDDLVEAELEKVRREIRREEEMEKKIKKKKVKLNKRKTK